MTALSVAERVAAVEVQFNVELVFAEHTRRLGREVVLLHEPLRSGTMTTCYVAVADPRDQRDHITTPSLVDLTKARWCVYCWLGHRRCVKCSAPAGDRAVCAGCAVEGAA